PPALGRGPGRQSRAAPRQLGPCSAGRRAGGHRGPVRPRRLRPRCRLHGAAGAAARQGGAAMTKRRARAFFVVSTVLSALVFLALTVDSHRKIPALTNATAIDATVIAGKEVWHRNNCINCHSLLGEGAYYAPDLTQITAQRGASYLREFLKEPSRFYSEERDRRLMPTLPLSDQDITAVIAF